MQLRCEDEMPISIVAGQFLDCHDVLYPSQY